LPRTNVTAIVVPPRFALPEAWKGKGSERREAQKNTREFVFLVARPAGPLAVTVDLVHDFVSGQ
jgi:hypothetical protein